MTKMYMKIVIVYSFSKLAVSGGKSVQQLTFGSHEMKIKSPSID